MVAAGFGGFARLAVPLSVCLGNAKVVKNFENYTFTQQLLNDLSCFDPLYSGANLPHVPESERTGREGDAAELVCAWNF